MPEHRIANFGAGPSVLPEEVLHEAAKGLLNFQNMGMGIAEISHRSKEFDQYMTDTANAIREQLGVPPTHEVLFMQGGGTAQFSAVVLNMVARHRLLHPNIPESERVLDYVLSGSWSKAAHDEAKRLANGATVNVVADSRLHSADGKSFNNIPPHNSYKFSPNPALIYYCENETVSGTQFTTEEGLETTFPWHLLPKNVDPLPLVADYSSSFMSRPIPHLERYAIIYAGAQKNLGPAGLTIVIVRKDCIVDANEVAKLGGAPIPIGLSYRPFALNNSMPNTPPVLAIYITGLVLKRNARLGGLKYYEELNKKKKTKVYDVLEEGQKKGVFKLKVEEGGSWMNITFDVLGDGASERFVSGAVHKSLGSLKGHRSVGGMRVSLYNAVTEEWTDQLVTYMRHFIKSETEA